MDHYLAEGGRKKKTLLTRNNSSQRRFFHCALIVTGHAGRVCLSAVACSPRQAYLSGRVGRGRANRFVNGAVGTSVSRWNGLPALFAR